MIKNYLFILKLFALLTLVVGCSAEEDLMELDQSQAKKQFATFNPEVFRKSNFDYAAGFKKLMVRYDSLYETNYTGRKSISVTNKEQISSGPYIDFRVHSQVIEDNGNKVVVYPRVNAGSVIAFVAAVLSEDNSYIQFLRIDSDNELYKLNVLAFQKIIDQITARDGWYPSDTVIPEVDLTHPRPTPYVTVVNGPIAYPSEGGGGCDRFVDCMAPPDGGGGGGSTGPEMPVDPNTDPCEQTQALLQDPRVKPAIDNLKSYNGSGETGWKFPKNGGPAEITPGTAHSVNIGDPYVIDGFWHLHTYAGAQSFSPRDISQLMFVNMSQIDQTNGFAGVILNTGENYVIHLDGQYASLGLNYSDAQIEALHADQIKYYYSTYQYFPNISKSERFEKVFYKTLDMMGLSGKVNLQKVEGNTVKNIILNSDGTTTSLPCN